MARRKEITDALEQTEHHAADSTEPVQAQVAGRTQDPGQQDLARLRKMLEAAKAKQDMQKKAQDIVYARGIDRDAKEEQIIALGYSPSQAAEIMMDKDDIDQNGHAVVRPGFTRDQRTAAARNVKHLEASVQKQEQRIASGSFTDREDARRNHENAGERTFG